MNLNSKNTGSVFANFARALFARKRGKYGMTKTAKLTCIAICLLTFSVSVNSQDRVKDQTLNSQTTDQTPIAGNKISNTSAQVGQSEFDNHSDTFVKPWQQAAPDYDDTEFGERMYNEASTPTKLEMLRLLSKDTPSAAMLMHAVSMGLELDEVLQAAVKFDPSKGRELASAAVNLLPVMPVSQGYLYSSYELEDIEKDSETQAYSVAEVIERFFKNRQVLRPYPDWYSGQYHFLASAAELKALQMPEQNKRWYKSNSSKDTSKRPVFVSLYEGSNEVLVDSSDRIGAALQKDSAALLPVVFIFNRLNERSIDGLTYSDENDKQGRDYPRTIRGVQQAFIDKNLILTPAPEWQIGDYHLIAKMAEVADVFNLPVEQDFEPEAWQRLLLEAKKYSVNDTAFLVSMTGRGDSKKAAKWQAAPDEIYASWDNPRSEERFKYVRNQPDSGSASDAKSDNDSAALGVSRLLADGLILNRPDLAAALKALGVEGVPVSFYYIDDARVAPYSNGPRALIQAAIGAGAPPGTFGDGGGFLPPPVETPEPASPPGVQ